MAKGILVISGQYRPTVFYNTVLLQKDDLIRDLIKAEGLSAKEGRLAVDDGSSLNWGKVMDLDLYLISIKLNHLNEPIELPFEISNKPYKELEKAQEIADKTSRQNSQLFPLTHRPGMKNIGVNIIN